MESTGSNTSVEDDLTESLDIKPPQAILLQPNMARPSRSRSIKREKRDVQNSPSETSLHRHNNLRSREYRDSHKKHHRRRHHRERHDHKPLERDLRELIVDKRGDKQEHRGDEGERRVVMKTHERNRRLIHSLRLKMERQVVMTEIDVRHKHLFKSEQQGLYRRDMEARRARRYLEKKQEISKKRGGSHHLHSRKRRRKDESDSESDAEDERRAEILSNEANGIKDVHETGSTNASPEASGGKNVGENDGEKAGKSHAEEVTSSSTEDGEEDSDDSSGTKTADTDDSDDQSTEHESNNNEMRHTELKEHSKSDDSEDVIGESPADENKPLNEVEILEEDKVEDAIPFISNSPKSDILEEDEEDLLPPYLPAIQGCRSVEEFMCLNKIEEGSYGVVYRARDKRTQEIVALKKLKMNKEKEGFPVTSLREINTLLKSQHPNIVTVREIVVGSNMDQIFIVMDFVEQDLKALMTAMKKRNQVFMQSEIKCLMQQLLLAVAHLHDNWILHRDLKTSNLLLSDQGVLKVGDFGLAREYGSPLKSYTPIVVTLWYRSPELLLSTKQYSTHVDVWSVGCVFGELLTMEPLFPGKSEGDQIMRIFKDLGTPTDTIWPGYSSLPTVQRMSFPTYPVNQLWTRLGHVITDAGMDLMNKFLTYNPATRITAEAALRHHYFQEAPVPTLPAKSALDQRKPGKEVLPSDGFYMEKEQTAASLGFSLKF